MRYVAIAALAATFWLGVATLRIIIHAPAAGRCHQDASLAAAPVPAPTVAPLPAPPPMPDPCGIEGWPHVQRDGWLTFRDLRCGISAAKPGMRACQRQFSDESFHANMRVLVGRSGRVLSAGFRRPPAGSPLAACLEAAMTSVTYPRSSERYEFILAWQGLD